MKFHIRHKIQFEYSHPVFIEPMTIRLRPRCDCNQRLLHFELTFEPQPAGLYEAVDLDENVTTSAWFNDLHQQLDITAVSEIETLKTNPFNFIFFDSEAEKIPLIYAEPLKSSLVSYTTNLSYPSEIKSFTETIASRANFKTLPFLSELAKEIYQSFGWVVRKDGKPYRSNETLSKRKGACRDLAVLFMDCCRAMGIASRFVSGYIKEETDDKPCHLHAWAEVYLPGGGWRGFDPTHGLAVNDHYVSVASSANPLMAAPTTGTFRGTDIKSQLHYNLTVRTDYPDSEVEKTC